MTGEIVLLMGPPASGKSTKVKDYVAKGYKRLNRDELGGKLDDNGLVYSTLRAEYAKGTRLFVLDNVYATKADRAVAIGVAKELGLVIRAVVLTTTAEQSQFFAARRQILQHGKLLRAEDYKQLPYKKDPNCFPPAAQFAYWKRREEVSATEGFDSVQSHDVKIELGPEYKNAAVIFDFDGTLRDTISGRKFPVTPDDIKVLPGRAAMLQALKAQGYILCGASNQSGVAKPVGDPDHLSFETATKCFDKTCELLGVEIDTVFATERGGVPQSYWRKPMSGMLVHFIEKYKLDPAKCTFVGDMKTDATAAERAGMPFKYAEEFFR